tara:strand:+ start:2666 stop:3394 length:729 start_codon:yes stop_codon:yes gene_type:complete
MLAILIPLCSKKQDWKSVGDIDFFNVFLDAFWQTISHKHNYRFYLGYDENDLFLKKRLGIMKKRFANGIFVELPKTCNGNPCEAWNLLYKEALKEPSNEYFYQCGSDIAHQSPNWDDYLINQLKQMNNKGIVGGCDFDYWVERVCRNQNGILENVMCTRDHYDTFGWFFPPEVKTWFSDDMITRIYLNDDSCKICPNIHYKNTNRVGGHNIKSRYVPPEKEKIAKTWKNIADKYTIKIFEKK